MENIKRSVFKKLEENWEDEVEFLQKLGRFPSTLGNEAPIQRFLASSFKDMGLETDAFIPDAQTLSSLPGYSQPEWSYDGRPIVAGKLPTKGEKIGKSIIFQGHIDVVSPEPTHLWDYDPWGATIVGDKMYGRGIQDMKSGVAAMIYAVKAIKDLGIDLGADVTLKTVYEEECTGNGALAAIERGYHADAALIPEPFGPNALIAQVGVIWMRVRVTGLGSHVESADAAVNAIEKSYELIEEIKRYRTDINKDDRKHPDFKGISHPLNVNIGTIQSGDWPSTVPSDCTFEVRVGLYPGEDPQEIKDELKERLLEFSKQDPWFEKMPPEITFYGFHAPGVSLDRDLEIFKRLEKAHNTVSDEKMDYISTTATTDIRYYNLYYDTPATCYGPSGGNMHAPNEWVNLQSVKDCTKVYAAFLLDWCGVRE